MTNRAHWNEHENIRGMAGMLLGIHDSFRATSAALRLLLDEEGEADVTGRMRALFQPLAHHLHHHHAAEEAMLFPLVHRRTGAAPERLVDDHQTLMARVAEVEEHLAAAGRTEIDELLLALDAELIDHLDREEQLVIPLLLELTQADAFRLMYGLV